MIKDILLFQNTFINLKIPKKLINELTKKYHKQFKNEFDKRQKVPFGNSNLTKDALSTKTNSLNIEEKCNPTSPVCFKTLEKNKQSNKKQSFFIYRQGFSPLIIPDYMENLQNSQGDINGKHKNSLEKLEKPNEETYKLMQKPENIVIIGRVHHKCVKKQLGFRRFLKKDDDDLEKFLNDVSLSNDEKVDSSHKDESSKNIRSSSLNKFKTKTKNLFTKPPKKKNSEKVNKSKDFFLNLFKTSFCLPQPRDIFDNGNIIFKPRIVDFNSFLSKSKQMQGITQSVLIGDINDKDCLLKKEHKSEKEEISDLFYENGLGFTPLSPLMDIHFYDQFIDQLQRSNSISFNKKFLGEHSKI